MRPVRLSFRLSARTVVTQGAFGIVCEYYIVVVTVNVEETSTATNVLLRQLPQRSRGYGPGARDLVLIEPGMNRALTLKRYPVSCRDA